MPPETPPPVQESKLADLLVRADSITSLVAHRHAAGLPSDVRDELLAVSYDCRVLTDQARVHDELAVLLAARWWPNAYPGDLTEAQWRSVYAALEKPA